MNQKEISKTLSDIRKRAIEVMDDYPAKEAEYRKNIEEAERAKLLATTRKEIAKDAQEYAAAEADIKDAETQWAFNTRMLDRLSFTPRMDEDEYNQAIETCKEFAVMARDKFRSATDKHLPALQAARNEYQATIDEINMTMRELDAGANILQNKYQKREITRQNAPSTFIDDPSEWKRHAVRINPSELFCTDENHEHPFATRISTYVTTWQATQPGKAYPIKRF